MDRMACVDVPELPLQLLSRRRPEWASRPVAVVDKDAPQGVIQWVSSRARAAGVRRGMRYAAGLSLIGSLHADTVPAREVEEGVALLAGRLRRFSPGVEPHPDLPGTFWLDASGLEPLYRSLRQWVNRLREDLETLGFRSNVVVGFERFATVVVARAGPPGGAVVFASPGNEKASAGRVSIDYLPITPRLRDFLEKLGVRTVEAFLALPPGGVQVRFGPQVHRLQQLAAGRLYSPLHPLPPEEPRTRWLDLEGRPETDAARLAAVMERLLEGLLEGLRARQELLRVLEIRLRLDEGGDLTESLRPAAPTTDLRQLAQLVRLRLETLALASGVTRVRLTAEAVRAEGEQLALFDFRPRRDPKAADRALARVRAEFGEGSVVRARLLEGHLPEARFSWEPFDRIRAPRPAPGASRRRRLVRRIYARPIPLAPPMANQRDGWLLRGAGFGQVMRMAGPYVVSGGWWTRPIHREYHFALLRDGELLWIYHDRVRRRWFLQGQIE